MNLISHKTLLWSLLIFIGFLGALLFWSQPQADSDVSSYQIPDSPQDDGDTISEYRPHDPNLFVGDLGGIFLAPYGTPVPKEYPTFRDICGSSLESVSLPLEQSGALSFDIDLPKEYIFEDGSANACDNVLYEVWKNYVFRLPGGRDASVQIDHSLFRYIQTAVSTTSPQLIKIADRDVVITSPLTIIPGFDVTHAWIPEPFGVTSIHITNLPQKEFMELINIVASSTKVQ